MVIRVAGKTGPEVDTRSLVADTHHMSRLKCVDGHITVVCAALADRGSSIDHPVIRQLV